MHGARSLDLLPRHYMSRWRNRRVSQIIFFHQVDVVFLNAIPFFIGATLRPKTRYHGALWLFFSRSELKP